MKELNSIKNFPYLLGNLASGITESKFILLATQQTNKLRGKVLGQQIVTLFRKPQIQEDGGLMS